MTRFLFLALIRFWGRWLFGEVSIRLFRGWQNFVLDFFMCSEDHFIVYGDVCRRYGDFLLKIENHSSKQDLISIGVIISLIIALSIKQINGPKF